jgi:two-component sensor histidine kinase
VLGLTRLLLSEELSPRQRRYVELADASAASLMGLIEDLLDLGKIESGRMELEFAPFRLDELLDELHDIYGLRAQEKGLRFSLEVDPQVPQAVRGDPGRLRQILNNLLSNALKFTAQGEFGLMVGRSRSRMMRFTVYDTGIGIPFEVQQRLFTRFTQADRATGRRYGGTGLGLAIVKQLSDMMGGTILLQSEPGRGTSLRCELPLQELPLKEGAAAPAGAGVRAGAATGHPRPGGRGQRDQPGGRAWPAGAGGLPRRDRRRRRRGSARRHRLLRVRPLADGLPHAAPGRLRGGAPAARAGLHAADHRPHGQCRRRRARALPRLGHERATWPSRSTPPGWRRCWPSGRGNPPPRLRSRAGAAGRARRPAGRCGVRPGPGAGTPGRRRGTAAGRGHGLPRQRAAGCCSPPGPPWPPAPPPNCAATCIRWQVPRPWSAAPRCNGWPGSSKRRPKPARWRRFEPRLAELEALLARFLEETAALERD